MSVIERTLESKYYEASLRNSFLVGCRLREGIGQRVTNYLNIESEEERGIIKFLKGRGWEFVKDYAYSNGNGKKTAK